MKLKFTLAALAALAAPAAHALTVGVIEADDVTVSSNVSTGANINGEQFTFSWDITGGDTGLAGISAAFEFSFAGQARVTFDDFVNGDASPQQSGFVLYRVGGDALTSEAPAGTTGGGVALVNGIDRILIGDMASAVNPGATLYDAIGGTDDFTSGTWVLGIFDSGAPASGSASFTIAAVPLPASALLLMAGLGGLGVASRRRKPA